MRHIKGIVRSAALVAAAAMAAGGPAAAATRIWIGGAGPWFDASRWSPPGSPAYHDDLQISRGSPQTSSFVTADGGGLIVFYSPGALGTFDYDYFSVGHTGSGVLYIVGGAEVVNNRGYIGYEAGSTGTVLVEGAGSRWTNSRPPVTDGKELTVGRLGSGALSISNGGQVANSYGYVGYYHGSAGTVTVDGVGSNWTNSLGLYVGGADAGAGGTGGLTVSNGATVNVVGTLKVWSPGTVDLNSGGLIVAEEVELASGAAFNTAAGSTLRINTLTGFGDHPSFGGNLHIGHVRGSASGSHSVGVGQSLDVGDVLTVGYDAAGDLSISNGGHVANTTGYIGRYLAYPGHTGTVTVDNATWTNTESLVVGRLGSGELSISNGGQVANSYGYIGYYYGSTSAVTVDDVGSSWTNSASLYVGGRSAGPGGTGSLTVSNGGTVNVGDMLRVWGPGSVDLLGGTLVAGTIDHAQGGSFNFAGGRLHVGAFQGSLTNAGGTLAPGSSPGTTVVIGNYTQQAAGVLEIEIAGTAPGQWDVLYVMGTAQLDGELKVVLDSYSPATGDSFAVMTYGSRSGEFADTTGWQFDGNKALVKAYGANALTLFATYQGDATLDFCVDGLDYIVWSGNYGQSDKWWQEGDFTGEGYVDGLDYIVWSNNYDAGCPSIPGAVPEPATLSLLPLGAAALMRRRRK